jgi:hypothetical protein
MTTTKVNGKMSYDAFKVLAFTQYGINPQPLEVVRDWVENQIGEYHNWGKSSSLGYAELSDIQTISDAMDKLKEIIWESTLMETPKKTARELEKFNKDAGGRVGKGFYRYALKAYYLSLEAAE